MNLKKEAIFIVMLGKAERFAATITTAKHKRTSQNSIPSGHLPGLASKLSPLTLVLVAK